MWKTINYYQSNEKITNYCSTNVSIFIDIRAEVSGCFGYHSELNDEIKNDKGMNSPETVHARIFDDIAL